ncbi:only proline and serine are matching in the corresponding protein [Colletotrichum graminicola]|uniref:Only prolin and serin are matching in the corresponding protein n=1 Tax=Colletotrichum graminicola (strain M1.001 / M2 / FGSC 10212) TaxID=645133 RepID=E3R0K7_COLGM|nr:only proline and serin are matching in the corresponding protein [Colletotrichum graminicola M1.001]EFQ36645.1 only prolin and serin are matching in the corresponding protein [Colletotrichum graminicola M1.001]WDK22158.1 only proline and serine are matching in the corresponding protein [Colletotrichum graminicola]
MSPKLKPLLLPQLVEERRKFEDQSALPEGDMDGQYVYCTTNSSSSDVASPVTPTFSTRGHLRYSSSTSSLDLPPPLLNDTPSSPTSTAHTKSSKRPLPDVQEEPVERDEPEESTILVDQFDLYDCLCDEPCIHHESSETLSVYPADFDIDYDLGFASDSDFTATLERKRSDAESSFSGLATRFGTRFPNLSRWKSTTKRSQLTASPTTGLSFENVHSVSRAASSRSSSLSGPSRHMDSISEPPIPTPATSVWESRESMDIPPPIDIEKANNERVSIERDRALATTPLLPPLLTTPPAEAPHPSPLQSPTVAPSPLLMMDLPSSQSLSHLPTPALSTRPSVSSFRHMQSGQELPIGFPSIVQDRDEWSDRLGHANFTITPQPYQPVEADMESLRLLRADWEAARINYTKHLVRTGENYGETSKIYALTEAKWAETERSWRTFHDQTMENIVATSKTSTQRSDVSRSRSRGRVRASSGGAGFLRRPVNDDDAFANMQWRRLEDGLPTAIPRLVDAEGKFPARGDEDIVGPMERDTKMIRTRSEERRSARFWRALAEKVGFRK